MARRTIFNATFCCGNMLQQFEVDSSSGGAGRPSHNTLRINYIINRRLSRDLLVVSGVHDVKFTVS